MASESLFGHLALRFTAHPEDLATEALHYVLHRSFVAQRAFRGFLGHAGARLPEPLVFKTQEAEGDSRFDLVGIAPDGARPLIVESKFWAGLTDRQPVEYVHKLPPSGVLLVIAPAARLVTLAPELIDRLVAAGFPKVETAISGDGLRVWPLPADKRLVLATWPGVLEALQTALVAEQAPEAADVAQLRGLCARMDQDAFRPLRSEELSAGIGQRICDFSALVDDATKRLVSEGLASVQRLRASAGWGWWGRYMVLAGIPALLHTSAWHWAHTRETPLWLTVYGEGTWDGTTPATKSALTSLMVGAAPRAFEYEGRILVPLALPLGVERDRVIDAIVGQIREVAKLLEPIGARAVAPAAPPPSSGEG